MFTTTPRWPSASASVAAMTSAASRSTLNVPSTLTMSTVRNSSRSWGPLRPRMRADGPIPAQLTTIRSGTPAALT